MIAIFLLITVCINFVVYKKDANDKWIQIGTADANKLVFTDSNTVAGKTYCYAVKARYFMGFEEPSNEACITMPGTTPAVLRVVLRGTTMSVR